MPTASRSYFTSGELGDVLGVQSWKITRLFELGLIPETPRVGGRRLISNSLVPVIVDLLRTRGWLATDQPLEARDA